MAEETTTTIQISLETWQELNTRKKGPDESFDDVVQRLLKQTRE